MSFQRYQDPAADAALGTTTDDPYTGTGAATLVSLMKGLFLKPVSTLTGIGDGGNVAQGATTDAAYTSGSGTVIALLKGIFTRLRGGSATMANSLPVTLASDQGTIGVLAADSVTSGPVTATVGAGSAVTAVANGYGAWAVTITGTWTGTLLFEGTIDGTNWFAVNGQAIGNLANVATTSVTANGHWRGLATDLIQVRVRASVWSSGTATVTFALSANPAVVSMATALPAGSNSIGGVVQQATASGSGVLQSAATATGVGTPLTVLGYSACILTLSGSFVGTVTIQGTEDGTNWSNLSATQLGTAVIGATATASGLYEFSVAGLQAVRANITAYTSGAITVTGHAAPLPWSTRSVNAILAAGESHLGAVGGNTAIVAATLTRPANTTAYAAGQSLANSTTAPTAIVFANCARLAGGTGLIVGATLLDETNQTTKGSYELWLFAGTAAPTLQNDGSAFAPSNSDAANLVAVIPFTIGYVGNTAATSSGNVFFMGDAVNKPFKCGAGVTSLWGALVVRNAYTPISGELLVPTLTIVQD